MKKTFFSLLICALLVCAVCVPAPAVNIEVTENLTEIRLVYDMGDNVTIKNNAAVQATNSSPPFQNTT